jgi:glutamyl-tRNA synthetase
MKYITRFAPSPTGKAHVGNIRTALFDYLASRSSGGQFNLRIEDTDRERFVPEAIDYIHKTLAWLGLKPDGEVIYQSDRINLYQKRVNELVEKNLAYKCFCSHERLEKLKKDQKQAKKAPVYDRHCLNLTKEEISQKQRSKNSFVIRFRIPDKPKEITWDDKIRDKVTIATETLEDFIILKSDGWPTYNLANVIDDHEQKINLAIRGEEFIPSTPKHILLYQAFGWPSPEFAHMPLTLGKDKTKLSKRHGDTAILNYKDKGYLAEAMINFLVLLGWNPGGGSTEEIFSLKELEKIFRVENINKAAAVFNLERLDWMNGIYIRKLSARELTDRIIKFNPKFNKVRKEFLERIVAVEQTRLKTLADFAEISDFYFNLPKYSKNTLIFKKSSLTATKIGLEASYGALKNINWAKFKVEDFDKLLARVVAENKLNNADIFWPVRVALSGKEKSPSPAELLWVFGQEESLKRLEFTLKNLKN